MYTPPRSRLNVFFFSLLSLLPQINFSISENATDSEDTLVTQSSDESVCVTLTAHSHFSNVETEILMFAGMVSYDSVCSVTLMEEKGTRKRSQSGEEANVYIKLKGQEAIERSERERDSSAALSTV